MPVDGFESKHKPLKESKLFSRTTKNVLWTMITKDERKAVYNMSSSLLKKMEKDVKKGNIHK